MVSVALTVTVVAITVVTSVANVAMVVVTAAKVNQSTQTKKDTQCVSFFYVAIN
jgi:hypothetical protein